MVIFFFIFFSQISTTTATSANERVDKPNIDNITRAEQSWVRNMLYGSGPSADVNELEEEEEEKFVETVQAKYMDVIQKPTVLDRYKSVPHWRKSLAIIQQGFCLYLKGFSEM